MQGIGDLLREVDVALILVADGEKSVNDLLKRTLQAHGHEIEIAYNGIDALSKLRKRHPDLAIVGSALPLLDGTEVCRRVKADPRLASTLLLLLASGSAIEDKIQSFEAGCDDYLAKPFDLAELRMRVRALLRRVKKSAALACLSVGELSLDPQSFQVHVEGRTAQLTPMQFELLSYLVTHTGQVLSTAQLLHEVWNYPPGVGNPGLVRVHIKNLRAKIERSPESPQYIQTVSRHGYKINGGDSSSQPVEIAAYSMATAR